MLFRILKLLSKTLLTKTSRSKDLPKYLRIWNKDQQMCIMTITRNWIIFKTLKTLKLKPRLKYHHSSSPRVTNSNLVAVGWRICKLENGLGNLYSNQFKPLSSNWRNSKMISRPKVVLEDATRKHQIVQDTEFLKNWQLLTIKRKLLSNLKTRYQPRLRYNNYLMSLLNSLLGSGDRVEWELEVLALKFIKILSHPVILNA